MCDCECYIYARSMHSSLLSWRDCYFKNSSIIAKMLKAEGLRKKKIRIYETYKNTVTPHGRHIYAKSYDMAKATVCANSQSDHALPHWKCVLRCCAKFPCINIPDQETDDKNPNPSPSISFRIYHLIARCTKHDRLPLTDKKMFSECQQYTASGQSTKYTLEKS